MNFLENKWYRIIIAAILFIILLLICYYYNNHNPWLSLDTCLKDPIKYHGAKVTNFREPMIGKIHADGFILKQKNRKDIKVYADTTGLTPNKYIGLVATFYKEGYLKANILKVSANRRYKILLSIIPTLLVLFLFTRVFRWNGKNLTWRSRSA